jgi:hypothetical protein
MTKIRMVTVVPISYNNEKTIMTSKIMRSSNQEGDGSNY